MANWQSIDELQDIASDLPRFTHALDELSRRLGLDITPLTADHISLRCHQNVTAERWRRGFEQCGELLSGCALAVFHCGATVARGKTLPARRLGTY